MLATLDRSRPASNGTDSVPSRTDVTVVTSDDFDDAVNGLIPDKNPAAIGCDESVGRDLGDGAGGDGSAAGSGASTIVGCVVACVIACSTWSGFGVVRSLQLSDDTPYLRDDLESWCNFACNSWSDGWRSGSGSGCDDRGLTFGCGDDSVRASSRGHRGGGRAGGRPSGWGKNKCISHN